MLSALIRMTTTCNERSVTHSREPTLGEMLAEPIIRAIMKADGVSPGELKALVKTMKARRELVGELVRGAR